MNSLYVSISNKVKQKDNKKRYKYVNNNCIARGKPMIELKFKNSTYIFLFMINQINSVLREE
ncbi:Uncharacterised protein [Clostridium putrefaciens]|uniref:Uncharacterized protein n=1 Tax=Clostridium putrefaciens TaxID=99675 RepID=A0A381JAJ7_9CLOT|nr:hypothetical protein [Clostridium putrefaciens]SUY47466.1 Uncharacterised protein [Clostridium putrefaciens]